VRRQGRNWVQWRACRIMQSHGTDALPPNGGLGVYRLALPVILQIDQGIANTGNGLDVGGAGRIRFDLVTQPVYQLLQHAPIAALRSPYSVDQGFCAQHLSRVKDEYFQ
jgi:hypothetical protein